MQRREVNLVGTMEVSRRLGVSPSWVRARSAAGKLPHFVCGGVRKFDLAELLAFLRREVNAAQDQAASAQ